MTVRQNLVILEKSGNFSFKLRERASTKGIATHVVGSLREAMKALPGLARPILFVEAEPEAGATNALVKELQKEELLHGCPIVLMTHDSNIDAVESALNKYFKMAIVLAHDAPVADLMESVKYI